MIRPEYLHTLFIPKKPGINQSPPDWSRPFAILTAHNPGGKKVAPETNAQADKDLKRTLSRRSLVKHRVTAVAEDWSHEEKSFAVWGLNHQTASEIGRQYRQDAYFWVENGTVTVHSCISGKTKSIGRWKDRLRSRMIPFPIRIYVLELRREVLKDPSFLKQNPTCGRRAGLGCLYVGSSADVEKRIRIHLKGPGPGDNKRVRGSKLVRKYFLKRRKDLEPTGVYETSGHAVSAEAMEAESLRESGYYVYSN